MLAKLRTLLTEHRHRPQAFRDVTEIDWGDPLLGERFLRVGRRSPEQTEQEVAFLIGHLDLPEGSRVLDVMCGDGRIALPLALHGCSVSGVDINPFAIDQARRAAAQLELSERASFCCADVRTELPAGEHDVAICIFGHLSGFEMPVAAQILRRVRAALVERGTVLIDMHLAPAVLLTLDGTRDWDLCEGGWLGTDQPALVLNEHFADAGDLTYVRRSHCLDLTTGDCQLFGQAGQFYDRCSMTELLRSAGFEALSFYGELDGRPYDDATSENLVVIGQALPEDTPATE